MKKLLIILVALLWCNVAVAKLIEYKKCFPIKEDGIDVKELYKSFNHWSNAMGGIEDDEWLNKERKGTGEFFTEGTITWEKAEPIDLLYEGPKWDDYIFSINIDAKIVTNLEIHNDEWIQADYTYKKKWYRDKREEAEEYFLSVFGSKVPFRELKFEKKIYEITDFVGGILEAIYVKKNIGTYMLNIDVNTNKVYYRFEPFSPNLSALLYTFQCNKQTSDDNELNIASGTAFFINNKGNLLTNNHVIDECVQSKINYFNKEYDAQLIATDKNLDLALLKVDIIPRSFISFSKNKVKKRDEITAAGYPLGIEFSDDLKINDGKVSSLKGLDNNSNHITHNININPGNSGGPIVNNKGELVAVAVSGMSKEITEGLNFGIKSSAVENFLRSNNINPKISSTKFSMNNDKVNQLLEESTVYTFCEIK